MQIILRSEATCGFLGTRPIIRLATGTLTRMFNTIDPGQAFKQIAGLTITINVTRMEQAGNGVDLDSPPEAGPVEFFEDSNRLAVDVAYNEIGMVLDRVGRDQPGGRSMPAARDYLDTFAQQVDVAMNAAIAWCDGEEAWADRNHVAKPWRIAMNQLKAGKLCRPYEFTLSDTMRTTLDYAWTLIGLTPLEDERYDMLAEAYLLLRDVGWQDADYEADTDAEETEFGQPAKLSNLAANLATAPPPEARQGYSPF